MTITAGQKAQKSLFIIVDGVEHRYIKSNKGNWIHYDAHHDPLRNVESRAKQAILNAIKRAPGVTIIL
jgi:hypothetical protein